jgi:hypothetical protein
VSIVIRSVFVAAGAAALVVATAVPANAVGTAAYGRPSVPTAVAVSGTASLDATVTWSAPTGGGRVTGYSVAITPAEQQPNDGVDTLSPAARSDRFGALTAGTTYSFAVRAVGRAGSSAPVAVTYTAPKSAPATQYAYALSTTGAVERFPVSGGAGTVVVPSGGSGYTTDDNGDVFVPGNGGESIVMYPASGSSRTIATGLSIAGGLQMDVAGNLYFVSGSSIRELPVTGGAQRSIGTNLGTWYVAADGTVTTTSTSVANTAVVTYPAGDGAATTRTLTTPGPAGYAQAITGDAHGDVFINISAAGGAGYTGWYELAPGSSALTAVDPETLFEAGGANGDGFVMLRSTSWCTAPGEDFPGPGGTTCVPDRGVADRYTLGADGTTTRTAMSGLTLGGKDERKANVGAVDAAGDLFVNIPSGPTTGLYRVSATGDVTQLDPGQFTQLQVSPAQ